MDHGVGVLSSLNKKTSDSIWYEVIDKAKRTLGLTTNEGFIGALLAGKLHQTVTKKSYRGKGLPNIKRMLDFKKINGLHIVTNNVYGDVTRDDYKLLKQDFKGTFYYWELCQDNEFKPWTII